jgi:hypothetical protein
MLRYVMSSRFYGGLLPVTKRRKRKTAGNEEKKEMSNKYEYKEKFTTGNGNNFSKSQDFMEPESRNNLQFSQKPIILSYHVDSSLKEECRLLGCGDM